VLVACNTARSFEKIYDVCDYFVMSVLRHILPHLIVLAMTARHKFYLRSSIDDNSLVGVWPIKALRSVHCLAETCCMRIVVVTVVNACFNVSTRLRSFK